MAHKERVKKLNRKDYQGGGILYWMSRDQRVSDNWALVRARELASRLDSQLQVAFCLAPSFLNAPWRHYHFMLEGLKQVERSLANLNVPFFLLEGDPGRAIPDFVEKEKSGYVVTDFSPLKIKQGWDSTLASNLNIPVECVDAHNIVPCWTASPQQEYAAYTFRPKLNRVRLNYLSELAEIQKQDKAAAIDPVDWSRITDKLKVDRKVEPVSKFAPGEEAAGMMLEQFIEKKLSGYGSKRNDPNQDSVSNMSIYLHYGQISAQKIALAVEDSGRESAEDRESFLEELLVRRELSDNYCYYNKDYDNFKGFPKWARKTLNEHRDDRREHLYSRDEFEDAATHDPLWNAAQLEMVRKGKMHGFMRMYWAKKILEWTGSPEEAQEIAIYLNDRYELDGRDPNGYAGIAWSIGGVHDRAWFERDIFGKIRYMNFNGARRKFNIKKYIDQQNEAF